MDSHQFANHVETDADTFTREGTLVKTSEECPLLILGNTYSRILDTERQSTIVGE